MKKIKQITEALNPFLETEEKEGFYINKIVYFEAEDINADVNKFLKRNNGYWHTDYDIVEFSPERLKEILDTFETLERKKADGTELTKEEFIAGLGSLYDLLMNGEIDFAIKIFR